MKIKNEDKLFLKGTVLSVDCEEKKFEGVVDLTKTFESPPEEKIRVEFNVQNTLLKMMKVEAKNGKPIGGEEVEIEDYKEINEGDYFLIPFNSKDQISNISELKKGCNPFEVLIYK